MPGSPCLNPIVVSRGSSIGSVSSRFSVSDPDNDEYERIVGTRNALPKQVHVFALAGDTSDLPLKIHGNLLYIYLVCSSCCAVFFVVNLVL